MAAYNFKFFNDFIGENGEFMFGNLDEEVDMQAALKQAFIENEYRNLDEEVSKEVFEAETELVKVDQETMTAVIIVNDSFIGRFTIVGLIEPI